MQIARRRSRAQVPSGPPVFPQVKGGCSTTLTSGATPDQRHGRPTARAPQSATWASYRHSRKTTCDVSVPTAVRAVDTVVGLEFCPGHAGAIDSAALGGAQAATARTLRVWERSAGTSDHHSASCHARPPNRGPHFRRTGQPRGPCEQDRSGLAVPRICPWGHPRDAASRARRFTQSGDATTQNTTAAWLASI